MTVTPDVPGWIDVAGGVGHAANSALGEAPTTRSRPAGLDDAEWFSERDAVELGELLSLGARIRHGELAGLPREPDGVFVRERDAVEAHGITARDRLLRQ